MVSGFNFWAIYRLSGICGILLWLYRYTDKSLDVSIWWIIAENFGQCVSWSAVGLGEKILEMPSFNLPPHGYRLQNGDAWLPKNTCRKCWFTAKARFFWRATLRVQRRYCIHPIGGGERKKHIENWITRKAVVMWYERRMFFWSCRVWLLPPKGKSWKGFRKSLHCRICQWRNRRINSVNTHKKLIQGFESKMFSITLTRG